MSLPKTGGSRMDFSNLKTSLIAGVPTPLLVLTAEGRIQAWSFASTELLGLETAAFKGRNICDFAATPQDAQKIREWLEKQKDPGHLETALLRKGGPAVEVELSANIGIGEMRCCQIKDLTLEARVMKELDGSRGLLRQQTEILNECQAVGGIGSWDIDLLTNRLFWTAETYRMHGVDEGHYTPTLESALKFYTPASATLMSEAIGRAIRYAEPFDLELEIVTADERRIWTRTQAQVQTEGGRAVRIYGVIRDTTKLRGAMEELRENQRVFSTLLSNLPGMAYRCKSDADWTMEFVSDGCLELTGYAPSELLENRTISYEQITHPEERDVVRRLINDAWRLGKPYELTYRIVTARGAEKWVWERGETISDEDGKLLFLEGFITDVTERRLAQEKVREQAALLDKAQDAILVTDMDGRVQYWNKSAVRVFGWADDDVMGRMVDELFIRDRGRFLEARRNTGERGDWSGELRAISRNNNEVVVESRWTLVKDDLGRPQGVLAINTDVTDRKKLEAQFLRAQRMESIGTLAGGIAHDLNNILSPIVMALDLLSRKTAEPYSRNLIEAARGSADRGVDMVRQILGFARGVEGKRITVQPKELIRDLQRIIGETFPKSIRIQARISKQVWSATGDPTQLHQVLLNLCVNARDAMPEGGQLIISADNVDIDEQYVSMNPQAKNGRYVMMQVTDTGTGIPESLRERIFDPFFTTKEVGKGTGLGLSTALAIVKSHGGFLDLYTEQNRGTTFKIYLPARAEKGGASGQRDESDLQRGHGELILVVDDEAPIRDICRQTLEEYGYRVLTAGDGSEAIAHYRRRGSDIALVITDMMMPVMDGGALILALTRINARVKILATSGMASTTNLNAVPGGGRNFIAKPYTAETLTEAVAGILRGDWNPSA